jgi:hypothetical protein
MSFLRTKWSWPLLSTALFGLLSNFSAVRAIENSDQGVDQSDDVDLAKVNAGGKIVLISSGPRVGGFRAIDDDNRTTFRFSSDDSQPTLIVQLVEDRPVHRVSVVLESDAAKVDVYLLDQLPKKPTDLDLLKPVASIINPVVAHEASVDFPPQNARYVALRWTLSGTGRKGLNVAEVSVLGRGSSRVISASLAATDPPIYLVEGPPILPPLSP